MSIDKITVVKIGGNVVDDPQALDEFIGNFSRMEGAVILVHGGGKEATRLSKALGIETTMINGRRVTDSDTLNVVTMVYAGLINKRIVSKLQACGVNAMGLSGADAGVVRAVKRNVSDIDFGFVGDMLPDSVDAGVLTMLLEHGITPVFCAIMHDGHGQLLNCNADTVASTVAIASSRIAPTCLTFCFEKAGVLADPDDETTMIPEITRESYLSLRDRNIVSGGMLPKIDNAFAAIDSGVGQVHIKHASNLLNDKATVIRP